MNNQDKRFQDQLKTLDQPTAVKTTTLLNQVIAARDTQRDRRVIQVLGSAFGVLLLVGGYLYVALMSPKPTVVTPDPKPNSVEDLAVDHDIKPIQLQSNIDDARYSLAEPAATKPNAKSVATLTKRLYAATELNLTSQKTFEDVEMPDLDLILSGKFAGN